MIGTCSYHGADTYQKSVTHKKNAGALAGIDPLVAVLQNIVGEGLRSSAGDLDLIQYFPVLLHSPQNIYRGFHFNCPLRIYVIRYANNR
jgi:hypothetical protein